jgi:hypothetical protein
MKMDEEHFQRHLKAEDALRDILFMYRECLNYKCLYDDFGTEDGKFDPFFFIDCSEKDAGYMHESDLKLLHEGSAIKLASHALQSMGQGGYPENSYPQIERVRKLFSSKRMAHLPEFERFFELYLHPTGETWMEELDKISMELYNQFIYEYFQSLLR